MLETFGGHANTEIPLILAYDRGHYQGMLPAGDEDIFRSAELVKEMTNDLYTVKVSDIPCLLSEMNAVESTVQGGNVMSNSTSDLKSVEALGNKDSSNFEKSGFLSLLKAKDSDEQDDISMKQSKLERENEDHYFDEMDNHDLTFKRLSKIKERYKKRNQRLIKSKIAW